MALEKQTPTRYGVDALYWRVRSVEIQRDQGIASWTLDGYVSQAASTGLAVSSRVYHVKLADIAAGEHAPLLVSAWDALGTLLYTLSKHLPVAGATNLEFLSAKDV